MMRDRLTGVRHDFAALMLAGLASLLPLPSCAQTPAAGEYAPGLKTVSADPNARYRLVHLDTLDAKMQPIFEATRHEWVGVLNARRVDDGRGIYFLQDGHSLVSVHAFQSFDELVALRKFAATVNDRLGQDGAALTERYDAGDAALRSPHRTEIWEHDFDSDYIPEQG